jgi:hypothetical protein
MLPCVTGAICGCLDTWLTAPPGDPRPNKVEAGPSNPIEIEIVLRVEAADRKVVALLTAFAGGEADAGHIAQRIAHGRHRFVIEQLAWHFDDRMRGVDQGLGQFAVRRQVDLVAGLAALRPFHRDRRQLHWRIARLRPGLLQTTGIDQRHSDPVCGQHPQ